MRISGKQVAAARELLGLTQVELAAALGFDYKTVHRFEAGKAEPHAKNLEKLQRELEKRGIDFMNGDGPGVRLNIARAQEYARSQNALH